MNRIEKLMAEHSNIKFTFTPNLPEHLSGLVYEDNQEIFINNNNEQATQYTTLLEELAHYETGSGEIIDQDSQEKRKQETQARSIAYTEAVPLSSLIECFYDGIWSVPEIADHLDVTNEFLLEAIQNYRSKRGLVFREGNYFIDLRRNVNITRIK